MPDEKQKYGIHKYFKNLFCPHRLVTIFIVVSFLLKVAMILYYGNAFTFNSDDENYIRTARILLEKHSLVYYNVNEPTVFITPVFPIFVATIFRIFGSGFVGLQAARIAQAVLSSFTLLYIYLIAKHMFDSKTSVAATFIAAFYPPNIVTVGYFLTETVFAFLLYALIYHFICATRQDKIAPYICCGMIWGVATLCRPVIALLPGVFYFYEMFIRKVDFRRAFKTGMVMLIAGVVVLSPWWIRNFAVFGEFIPLSESSGNPMLQGTYINYDQSNPTIYKMQPTERAQNKEELRVAKKRMAEGFKNNTLAYISWYTLGKTIYLWAAPFYWKEFLGITRFSVNLIHGVIITGFIGMILCVIRDFRRYSFYALILLYFNVSYCVYLTFDRYGYPLMPIVIIFFAQFIIHLLSSLIELMKANSKGIIY